MTLEDIFPELKSVLATDANLKLIPFFGQIATAAADAAEVKDFNKHLETALADPGVAFVAIVSEGEDGTPRAQALDLQNTVVLSVVENPAKNTLQLTAFQIVRRALLVLKRAQVNLRGARAEFSLGKPAYNVGPLNKGTTVYFINLSVRTTEPLGAVDPV